LSWTYDRYGNGLQQSIISGCSAPMTCPTYSVFVNPRTNALVGPPYQYDLTTYGNLTNDGLNTLAYDAENRVTSSAGIPGSGSYAYDGNSLRVSKTTSGATTVYIFSGSKVIAEYASGAAPASPAKEYIYAGSQLLATIAGLTTSYQITDHLSPRVTTDVSGNKIGEQAHFPFGQSWYANNTTTKWQFTSYEHDAESANDYAMTRYNVNRLGRFSSPDPLAGSIADPQSMNRYSYVRNDSPNLIDPLGLHWECVTITVNGISGGESCTWVDDPGVSGGGGAGWGGRPRPAPYLDSPDANIGPREARILCAIKFGQSHSLAAAVGAIFGDKIGNNFVTQLLLGNSASSLVKIGNDIFGSTSPDARQVAGMYLKGVGQGIPNLPGGIPVTGPVAPVRNAALGAAITAGYNAVTGAGQETLQLGISASNVASSAEPLLQTTVQSIVGYAALAKFGIDVSTFLYGYFVACKPK